MATDKNFIDFICEQLSGLDDISYKKMFGEYMIYYRARPIFLVCDNTVFAKQLPEVLSLFNDRGKTAHIGIPYKGAKTHCIVDIDDGDFSCDLAMLLYEILPAPKPKKKQPA